MLLNCIALAPKGNRVPREYRIARVVPVHASEPYLLREWIPSSEKIVIEGRDVEVNFVIGLVPLDCIDDISRAHIYNPRRLKEDHRDELMDQIGTYGLVYPLVATLEKLPDGARGVRLFLIDGRHRYNGLLELDAELKSALQRKAIQMVEARESTSLSDPRRMRPPRQNSMNLIQEYKPAREDLPGSKKGSPLITVKIYLSQDDVERIGMAVFLNRGQKKLAGGEQIEKLAIALKEALREENSSATKERPASEERAVQRVVKNQTSADVTLVVLSRHVAEIMDDEGSAWFVLIGRWQGEVIETETDASKKIVRRKPLTASNFLAFAAGLVNDKPLQEVDERQRTREVGNLNRLGELFATAFGWPDDIPTSETPYTATAVLCRSFLIRAVGTVFNEVFGKGGKVLSKRISDDSWAEVDKAVAALQEELARQAVFRRDFEGLKVRLGPDTPPPGPKRNELLRQIDVVRGKLWSLDTVIPALKGRLYTVLGVGP